MNNFTNKI